MTTSCWRFADGVRTEELMRLTEQLARGVRLSGSRDEADAFELIEAYLADIGYAVQLNTVPALIGFPVTASVEVIDPIHEVFDSNGHAFSTTTPRDGAEGILVDLGNGAPEDYDERTVRGRVALSTGLGTATKAIEADRAGALAQIHINDDLVHDMCISPVWGTPTPSTAGLLPRTPAVSVSAAVGERLRGLVREHGSVRVRVKSETYLDWRPIPLLTAELPGAEEDTFTLFSGHVDSWHHGAMDNASANAVQLEVARLLAAKAASLRRGVRIAFWSGHSQGRFAGSAWYADNFARDLHERCICHVNIDSVGAMGATLVGEAPTMAETFEFGARLIREGAEQELEYRRIPRAGDQSFWGLGIPSLFISLSEQVASDDEGPALTTAVLGKGTRGGGLGWWWHTPEDTFDKIDPEHLLRDARIYAAALWELCTVQVLPFDFAAAAREISGRLREYQADADEHLELRPLIELSADLASEIDRFATFSESLDAGVVNRTLVALGHALIPVNYTISGPFDHDLALATVPVPGLARVRELSRLASSKDEYHCLRTELVRQSNRIERALLSAAQIVESAAAEVTRVGRDGNGGPVRTVASAAVGIPGTDEERHEP